MGGEVTRGQEEERRKGEWRKLEEMRPEGGDGALDTRKGNRRRKG